MKLNRPHHLAYFVCSFVISFCFSSRALSPSAHWDLNDVTVIFPIPTYQTFQHYLLAQKSKTEAKDDLLPASFLNSIVDEDYSRNIRFTGGTHQDTLAIAFRIDPCFKDRFEDLCKPQVRVVWQPFVTNDESHKRYGGIDVSIHTFYDLTREEFLNLKNEIDSYRNSELTRNKPLGVHPALLDGPSNLFWKSFLESMKKRISLDRLTRIAVFTNGPAIQSWNIKSFDVKEGLARPVEIPIGGSKVSVEQSFVNWSEKEGAFDGRLEPIGSEKDDQFGSLNEMKYVVGSEVLKASLNAKNPKKHLPGTIDCISCHFSDATAQLFKKAKIGSADRALINEYKNSKYNLKNTTQVKGSTLTIRSLGYLDRDFILIDRVIFESAEVAERMNSNRLFE